MRAVAPRRARRRTADARRVRRARLRRRDTKRITRGQGTPGVHPYFVGAAAGRDVSDLVRCAARVVDPAIGTRWVAMGHSEGGHGALFTADVASGRGAPELPAARHGRLRAGLATRGLLRCGRRRTPEPSPFVPFLVMMIEGHGDGRSCGRRAVAARAGRIRAARGRCGVRASRRSCANRSGRAAPARSFFRGARRGRSAAAPTSRRTSRAVSPCTFPVLIVQGERDEVVVPGDDRCARYARSAGTERRSISSGSRTRTTSPSCRPRSSVRRTWVDARFARAAAPSTLFLPRPRRRRPPRARNIALLRNLRVSIMHLPQRTVRLFALVASVALFVPSAAAAVPSPAVEPAVSRGLDLSNLDRSCSACTNFFQFADGRYAENHPIPPDHARFGNFDVLQDSELVREHRLLDDLAAHPPLRAPPSTDAGKLAIFYAACTDTAGRDARRPRAASRRAREDRRGERRAVARSGAGVARAGSGRASCSRSDLRRTSGTRRRRSRTSATAASDLPEREYYFRDDAKSKRERADYVTYVGALLALADAAVPPAAPPEAGAMPADLLALETRVATIAPTRAERRDPIANYHLVSLADFERSAPRDAVVHVFREHGRARVRLARRRASGVRRGRSEDRRDDAPRRVAAFTCVSRLVNQYASQLPSAYDALSFAFYGTELSGTARERPVWQRCAAAAGRSLQDMVSTVYARTYFTPAAKAPRAAIGRQRPRGSARRPRDARVDGAADAGTGRHEARRDREEDRLPRTIRKTIPRSC